MLVTVAYLDIYPQYALFSVQIFSFIKNRFYLHLHIYIVESSIQSFIFNKICYTQYTPTHIFFNFFLIVIEFGGIIC